MYSTLSSSVRINTDVRKRTVIQNAMASIEQAVTYPSEWFGITENVNKKPPLVIPDMAKNIRIEVIRQWAYSGYISGTLSVDVAKLYLWTVLNQHSAKLTADWTSFGRTIGVQGDVISIESLCNPESENVTPSVTGAEIPGLTNKVDIWLSCAITGIFRIITTTHADHQSKVIESLRKLLKSKGCDQLSGIDVVAENYNTWISDLNYVILMALIDMYMCKFQHHPYANLRFGTIGTRFRDCAALVDIVYINKLTGLLPKEIARWIWTKFLGDDIERITKTGNEIDKYDSYMPYFMCLCLSDKSPYSTSINPNFHMWTHVLGASIHSLRSINAKLVDK